MRREGESERRRKRGGRERGEEDEDEEAKAVSTNFYNPLSTSHRACGKTSRLELNTKYYGWDPSGTLLPL